MSATGELQSSGVMIAINVFVEPSETDKYLALVSPIAKRFLAHPECNFCEFLQSEDNPGNLRIVLGWTKDKEWYYETLANEKWFQDFREEAKKFWVKPPMTQHFNRVHWKND